MRARIIYPVDNCVGISGKKRGKIVDNFAKW